MIPSENRWICLARILRPQGRKGEVLAELYTASPDQFATQSSLGLAPNGFTERSDLARNAEPEPARIVAHWLPVGRNAGRVVLQFAGVTSIEQATALAGKEVVIPACDRPGLEAGSFYVSDLIGATVYNDERPVGVIAEVLFPGTPDGSRRSDQAAPLLSITSPEGDEILVPFVAAYIGSIDLAGKVLQMKLPEGLIDLNRPGTA